MEETQLPTMKDEREHPLVLEVRRRGSDAVTVRDAAHEAHHALTGGAKKWDRESIHRALMRKVKGPGFQVGEEILARAVEQIVCADLSVPCWPVEEAAHVMWLELAKNGGIALPTGSFAEDAIRRTMESKRAREAADRVLALVNVQRIVSEGKRRAVRP